MKLSRISFLLLFLLLPLVAASRTTSAQTLPAKAANYLDKSYPGWKLSSVADGCGAEFSKSKVSGDFNGDKKTDYAVKFLKGRKGYIVAFVSRGSDYKPIILESSTVEEIKYQGLGVAKKGETYDEIINDNSDGAGRRLQNDAPVGGTCESLSYFYIYKNGAFRRAFASD